MLYFCIMKPKIDKESQYKNQKRDYQKFFIAEGDKDFSSKRNKYVIEMTIKRYEQTRKNKFMQYIDKFSERADAVATYLTSRKAQGSSPIENYFGKRMMAYLRGQNIQNILRQHIPTKGNKLVHLPTDV